MAETLKLGNGNWATKKESLLAYNSENNNFKPLPFNFTRNSSATRVNKEGLIEVVSNNEPRIDFKDSSEGALFLEPQRSNLITYSEDFSQWTPTAATILSNELISPNGTINADKIIATSVTSQHRINFTSSNTSGETTFSFFAKSAEYNSCWGRIGLSTALFDLENGLSASTSPDITASIENYGNGWYRCVVTKSSSSANEVCRINITTSYFDTSDFLGDNISGIYIYGAQLEQGSYATSYIPTSGGIGTRVADVCNKGGNEQVINSTEGVLYFETKGFIDVPSSSVYIQLSKNGEASFNNSLTIQHRNNGYLRVYVNGTATSDIHFNENIDFTENHKIAVLYKLNGYKLFIDGVSKSLFGTPTQTVFSGLDNLSFDFRDALNWNGSIKDVRIYNTALTDQELIALTS